jgi:hypothetical protein
MEKLRTSQRYSLNIWEKVWSLVFYGKSLKKLLLPFKQTIEKTLHAADYLSYAKYSVALPLCTSFAFLYFLLLYKHTYFRLN